MSAVEAFMEGAPEEVRSLLRKHAGGNSLFRNQGNGHFADQSAAAGVQMGRWSWSSDAWDFDHDGYPDIYIANGMISLKCSASLKRVGDCHVSIFSSGKRHWT